MHGMPYKTLLRIISPRQLLLQSDHSFTGFNVSS